MKILIVEDYQGDVDLLLSRLKVIGCDVLVARTLEEGRSLAAEQTPDLILTDLNLGAGIEEGLELLGALRADPRTAAIPVVVHSVFVSHGGDMPQAMEKADGFLPKPFKFVELSQLVAKIRDAGTVS